MKAYEVWDAWVYCPSEMQATAGGESNNSSAGVILNGTAALDDATGWKVTVSNHTASDTTFTVYAVCMSGLTRYQHVNRAAQISPNSAGSVILDCPTYAYQTLGGGGTSDTVNNDMTATPIPRTRSWIFGMANYDSVQRTATGHVVCGLGVGNHQFVEGPLTATGPGQLRSSTATCPPGTFIVGGGGFGGAGARLTDSYPNGNGWTVYGHNRSEHNGYTAATAVCGT